MNQNPWINVPLTAYEGHMAIPSVGQAAMLAQELQQAVQRYSPRAMALIGCAGGNGLAEMSGQPFERFVCVDINSDYINALNKRFAGKVSGLETYCSDIESLRIDGQLDLVYGGLVFEYTRLEEALQSLARLLRSGGRLVALVQQPSATLATVTPTPYSAALSGVGESFRYVNPALMTQLAQQAGFQSSDQRTVTLESGKSFTVLEYIKS